MQIQRINENKLEILIDIQDLKTNNISFEDFMISPKDLCPIVLRTTFKSFTLIDLFAVLSKKIFVLVITSVRLHKKYINNIYITAKFNNFNNLCAFCKDINIKTLSSLYYDNNWYYLRIKIKNIRNYEKLYYSIKEFTNYLTNNYNKELIIKDQAIEILKRYS